MRHAKLFEKTRCSCNDTMRKCIFYIKEKCPKEKIYYVDNFLAAHGHCIMWLPPCMNDLNLLN